MSQFYHDIVTDKSFQFLAELNREYEFVLIGGWAVFLYTQSLKSKDIDIVLDYNELGEMKKNLAVDKNEKPKKYEAKTGEFDVDIYVPYYSELGIPINAIIGSAKNRSGFSVPSPEMLLMLKLYAWEERRGSIKGRKDELDILSLAFFAEIDWPQYLKLVNEFNFQPIHKSFISFLKKINKVPELRLNEQQVSKLKKRIAFLKRSEE